MKNRTCAALAAAAALAAPSAAFAAKPVPCGPLAVEDAAGDQQLHVPQIGVPLGQEAAELTDFTGFFLRADGSRVTGNLVISNLSKAVPDPASAIRWTLYYTVGEKDYYARAVLHSDGSIDYLYGENGSPTLTQLGSMKGEFHEGKDGVISFVIPPAVGGKAGTVMTGANAIAAYQTDSGQGSSADFMPDGSGSTFEATVPTCDGASAPPAPPATPPATPPAGQTPPSSNPPSTQSDFQVTVKPATLRAKKLKRGRKIAFTLSSGETVTDVTGTLLKGRKKVATGKLARLAGSGKLAVKPKGRLKKGAYTLVISGRRSDGSTGTAAVAVRVN